MPVLPRGLFVLFTQTYDALTTCVLYSILCWCRLPSRYHHIANQNKTLKCSGFKNLKMEPWGSMTC